MIAASEFKQLGVFAAEVSFRIRLEVERENSGLKHSF
jgi:hypothetical protein